MKSTLRTRKVLFPTLLFLASGAYYAGFQPFSWAFLLLLLVEFVIWSEEQRQVFIKPIGRECTLRVFPENLYIRRPGVSLQGPLDADEDVNSLPLFHEPHADISGAISIPLLESSISFRYRTDSMGRRITSEPTEEHSIDKPTIAIFGASATFGTGVSDESTFAWQLQERLPQYQIVNYGVAGFSAYEIWLLLRQVLRIGKSPKLVILCIHPALLGRDYGKLPGQHWHSGPRCVSLQLPWNAKRKLFQIAPRRWTAAAQKIPLRSLQSLLVGISSLRFLPWNQKGIALDTLLHVILKMQSHCEALGIPLIVCELTRNSWLGPRLVDAQCNAVSCDIDHRETSPSGKRRWTLEPFDGHPNVAAHRQIADNLFEAIEQFLHTGNLKVFEPKLRASKPDTDVDRFTYPLF